MAHATFRKSGDGHHNAADSEHRAHGKWRGAFRSLRPGCCSKAPPRPRLRGVLARHGVEHPNPFFAPIAAVIVLNAALGEPGLNAMRLLLGVVVGIAAGEAAIALLGSGYGPLARATFAAMAIATPWGAPAS